MNKPEKTTPSPKPHVLVRRWCSFTWLEYAVVFVILLILIALIIPGHHGYRYRHTCAICRLERIDYKWKYNSDTSTFNETACSKWYHTNVEATHQHIWIRSRTIVMINLFGEPMGAGDSSNRPGRAIWQLTPEQQITVYKNFPNSQDATVLFLSLVEPEMMKDRYDISTIESLRDWVEAGCVEEWEPPEIRYIPEQIQH